MRPPRLFISVMKIPGFFNREIYSDGLVHNRLDIYNRRSLISLFEMYGHYIMQSSAHHFIKGLEEIDKGLIIHDLLITKAHANP